MILKGAAYIDGELKNRYIGIKDEKIDFIKKSYDGDEDVTKTDHIILPGGIDLHVHFRDPGQTEKEDFFTGSKSAAFGGITTVADMPNNVQPIDNSEMLEKKIDIANERSCIDFALYALIGEDIESLSQMTKFFKVYMASSTDIDKSGFEGNIDEVYSNGGKVAFHCEDEGMFGEPGEDLAGYNKYRCKESELSAIDRLDSLPEGPKRVCHISTKKGLKATLENDYSSEVTPHHLFLNQDAMLGGLGKVNPPLRDQNDQINLWENYERDNIDFICSDHAPHLEGEKRNFKDAPAGIPGVETTYPLMLNAVNMGKISLSTVVRTISENPAEYLGVKKGFIREGYDADLVLTDFRAFKTIEKSDLHSKAGWSPFEGFNGIFPIHVISKGEYIIKNREFVGEKGRGKFISGQNDKE